MYTRTEEITVRTPRLVALPQQEEEEEEETTRQVLTEVQEEEEERVVPRAILGERVAKEVMEELKSTNHLPFLLVVEEEREQMVKTPKAQA